MYIKDLKKIRDEINRLINRINERLCAVENYYLSMQLCSFSGERNYWNFTKQKLKTEIKIYIIRDKLFSFEA